MIRPACLQVIALAAGDAAAAQAAANADSDSAYLAFLPDHGVSPDAPAAIKQTARNDCSLSFADPAIRLVDFGHFQRSPNAVAAGLDSARPRRR